MDNQRYTKWRFELPDDWQPDGLWCVSFPIPAGEDYTSALAGALGALTLEKSWARDPTGLGAKTVAKTWRDALYINPMSVSETCIIVPTPPIPGGSAADDAAAAVWTVFLQWIVHQLNTYAPTHEDCPTAIAGIMAELAAYGAGDAVQLALERLCDQLNDNPATREDYEHDCVYMEAFGKIRGCFANHPLDWLAALSDCLYDAARTVTDAIVRTVLEVGALFGGYPVGKWVADHGGIPPGGGAGFGAADNCEWIAVLDFRVSDWGFHNADLFPHQELGIWLNGHGWRTTTRIEPDLLHETTGMWLEREHVDFELHRTDAVYSLHYGELDGAPGNERIFYVYEATLQPYMATVEEGDDVVIEGPFTEWTTGESPMTIKVYTEWNAPIFSEPGFAELQQLIFYGRGYNPWLSPPD